MNKNHNVNGSLEKNNVCGIPFCHNSYTQKMQNFIFSSAMSFLLNVNFLSQLATCIQPSIFLISGTCIVASYGQSCYHSLSLPSMQPESRWQVDLAHMEKLIDKPYSWYKTTPVTHVDLSIPI